MSKSSFINLEVPPGVVKTRSGEGASGRWSNTDNVRFRNGKPEKRAGFQQYCPTTLQGVARGMDAWNTLNGEPRYAIGTNAKAYGSVNGVDVIDITPLRFPKNMQDKLSTTTGKGGIVLTSPSTDTGTLVNNPFATTSGSAVVTVTHAAHGHASGDYVFFSGATAVGGITPSGVYPVTVVNADSYTIVHGSAATSTVAAGGGAAVAYKWAELPIGTKYRFEGSSYKGGPSVGGVTLEGDYSVIAVVDGDHFTLYPTSPRGTLGTNPFTTVNGSPSVTVTHVEHGRETGDAVYLSGSTAVGGITPKGDYAITVLTPDTYRITHGTNATSAATGGGSVVTYAYGRAATATVADGGGVIDYLQPLTAPFATTLGSPVVTVTDEGHGAQTGDTVHIEGAAAVGGITLDGAYTVTAYLGPNSYQITHSAPATSAATGGGSAVYITYEISPGSIDRSFFMRPFGRGRFGKGYFGSSRAPLDAVNYFPRTWAIDNVGEDAILSPLAGTIYYWDMSSGGRADRIPNAPTGLRYACMTEERHLHALAIDGDPLVFGWADQNDINLWLPSPTNTANNSRRVRHGSALVAMTPVANGVNLIWTDTACYIHQYTGGSFVYNTRLDAQNSGLIAPGAFCVTTIGCFWMSQNRFLMWNGATTGVPNAKDVEDWVFGQIPADQGIKCFTEFDAINNSIDFYYVPAGSSEPTAYVTLNLEDYSWSNGTQTRTTGATFNSGAQNPFRVSDDGIIYKHEIGLDADGDAAASSVTLAPLEIAKGAWVEVLGLDPDVKRQVGDVEIQVSTYDRNFTNPVDAESASFGTGSEMVDLRSSGRHIALTFAQAVQGGDWALDTPQLEVKAPHAQRR